MKFFFTVLSILILLSIKDIVGMESNISKRKSGSGIRHRAVDRAASCELPRKSDHVEGDFGIDLQKLEEGEIHLCKAFEEAGGNGVKELQEKDSKIARKKLQEVLCIAARAHSKSKEREEESPIRMRRNTIAGSTAESNVSHVQEVLSKTISTTNVPCKSLN